MPTLLLIDDSAVVLHALTRRLRADGWDVRAEASVAGARTVDLDVLACAVVDIDLPDGSGVDLAAELLARRPSLPLAFFTASTRDAAGAYGPVFRKPSVEPLFAWIRGVCPAQPPPTK